MRKVLMLALIDGDILKYSFGAMTDDEGHPLAWPYVKSSLDSKIADIVNKAGASEYKVYLTGDNNFRIKEATILPYKGNRTAPKPHWHDKIAEYLRATKNHKVIVCEDYEADDGMAMYQYKDISTSYVQGYPPDTDMLYQDSCHTIICTLDKDLEMVPGWHYKWSKGDTKAKGPFFITESEGLQWFFKQLLMGDKGTDNILGLFGVGEKSKLVTNINKMTTVLEIYTHVQKKYENRFGSYWELFMHENARMLWMLMDKDDDIRNRLKELERGRQQTKDKLELY